jgi:hypothetical protein
MYIIDGGWYVYYSDSSAFWFSENWVSEWLLFNTKLKIEWVSEWLLFNAKLKIKWVSGCCLTPNWKLSEWVVVV